MRKSFRKVILLGALTLGAPAAAQETPASIFTVKPAKNPNGKDDPAAARAQPEPRQIATRLSTFGIPIVAPAKRDGVKEIQLHVSADQGKSWHLYYRVGPTDKFFPFKAAADGEYWFATRIVDSSAPANAEAELRAEMKVVIDSTPPRLSLMSEMSPSGEIIAKWQAKDPLLSTQSLKLEYQTSPTGPWRSIAIPHPGPATNRGDLEGSVSWFPREAGANINLRAEILDQAGNHAVALDRVNPGAIVRGGKPLEPPIAGPATSPKQEAASNEGTLASVSKWLGGAFGGSTKGTTPPADPFASSAPSDAFANDEPSATAPKQGSLKRSSSWSSSNMELTNKGVRRIPESRGMKKIDSTVSDSPQVAIDNPAREPTEQRTDKRGPGRLASASTVREPKRETANEEIDNEDGQDDVRPTIQPPENSSRDPASLGAGAKEMKPSADAAEEIPAPRAEPRLVPANRREEETEPESTSPNGLEVPERHRAVESLPNEESRAPIPSAPRKKPGEYRVRSPIASGIRGDERGVARPPATPPYRNASTTRDAIETSASSGRLPAGVEPIYTNRRGFGLEYDVNSVGSGGVSEVELWATRDGGQTWSRWGSDPDRRSPFDVEVDGEGVFGFRIVVMSRGGLSTRPPQSGDEADQWVVVDSTAPKVALRSAGYGTDERVGQLEISWDAKDANLTEKSVSLFYSDREEGPWTRIVNDLNNQGEYFWRVDSRIPPRIFIKVEVRDGAGNVASDTTREAIRVEGLVPSGKIRRIIPREVDNE